MAIEKSPDNPQVRQMLANPVKSITCFHPRTPPDVLQYLKVQSRVYVYGNFLCRCVLGFLDYDYDGPVTFFQSPKLHEHKECWWLVGPDFFLVPLTFQFQFYIIASLLPPNRSWQMSSMVLEAGLPLWKGFGSSPPSKHDGLPRGQKPI